MYYKGVKKYSLNNVRFRFECRVGDVGDEKQKNKQIRKENKEKAINFI